MKAFALGFLLIASMGSMLASAETFSSVQAAVAGLPELSILNDNTNTIALAETLKDPSFVGTLFAPTDAALKPIEEAVGGDLSSLLGDPTQVNDVFSTAVVPGKALMLADLKNGMTLTTLNGNTITVTIKQSASGPIYYINQAPLTGANIRAGKSIIHEMGSIVVPAEYQDMLSALVPPESLPAATATVDLAKSSASTGSTPVPTTTSETTGTTGSTTDMPEAGSTGSTSTTSTTAQQKNSAGSAVVGAALLAVPALLAVLL